MCDIIGGLWLSPGCLRSTVTKYQLPCGITRRTLCCWVQSLEESHQRRSLRRTQVVPIGRHVAAALDDLSNELVLRQPHCHAVQGWPSLSTRVSERVAVAALLNLKHERALPLQCGRAMNVARGHRIAAPRAHMRTPRRELRHASKRAERDRDHQHGNHRNRPALPAFFSFSRKKRQKKQTDNCYRRDDEQERRLERRWKKR